MFSARVAVPALLVALAVAVAALRGFVGCENVVGCADGKTTGASATNPSELSGDGREPTTYEKTGAATPERIKTGPAPIAERLIGTTRLRNIQTKLREDGHPWASVTGIASEMTLSGEAPDISAKRAAVEVVKSMLGGFALNDVSVVAAPPDPDTAEAVDSSESGESPEVISARVRKALSDAGHRWVEVAVGNGAVTLSGTAPNEDTHGGALAIARSLLTERDLDDKIAVASTSLAVDGDADPAVDAKSESAANDASVDASSGAPSDPAPPRLQPVAKRGAKNDEAGASNPRDSSAVKEGAEADASDASDKGGTAKPRPTVVIARKAVAERASESPTPQPAEVELGVEDAACQERFNELLAQNTVLFWMNRAAIKQPSYALLDRVAEAHETCRATKVRIEGHTDSLGNEDFNARLSQQRADAVKKYLVSKGVPADRLTAKGYGETRPTASNATRDGRIKNRRIELHVVGR